MAPVIDLDRVTIRHADRALFSELSLTIAEGERVGVIGINGTGKSTLLKVLAGTVSPDSGQVRRARHLRVAYLDQEAALAPGPVREVLGGGWELAALLQRLGVGDLLERPTESLSGGEAKRVALAQALVTEAELLVLDEPTNHIDLPSVRWLEQHLLARRGALVIVSHDRYLLDRVTTRMVELDRGRHYVHEGGYGAYLDARAARDEQAASAEAVRRNLARRELVWLRRGAPARTRKPQARVDAARELIARRAESAARAGDLELAFGAPRLGDKVIEASGLAYRYDGAAELSLSSADLSIAPDERLGIVGANGTGKTTLLDLLAGRRTPSAGLLEVGPSVVVGYYDQHGVELDAGARVRDLVARETRAPGAPEDNALMERFWFTGELPFARVATLSGGERRRLQLLLVLAQRPNVLLLDEPTNDLDLDTLRSLEDFLEEWPGALVTVSHDQTFLARATDRLVALGSGGTLRPIVGGLVAWLEALEREVPSPRRTTGVRRDRRDPPTGRPRSPSTVGRLLREAEKGVARATRLRDELAERFAAATGHEALATLGYELHEANEALCAAEERWLELAEEQERLA